MGSFHEAFCDCGYSSETRVGGSRRTFLENSTFPFYCKDCGLVAVNIAKLSDEVTEAACPTCGRDGCMQYGTPPVSLWDLRPRPWWRSLFWKKHGPATSKAFQWGGREVTEGGHLCPACQRMNLRFSHRASVMFD